MRIALLIIALSACEPHDVLGTGWDFGGITSKVYECDVDGMTLELCWPDGNASLMRSLTTEFDADTVTVTCRDTPRHLGPCNYGCSPHSGCNAVDGCWCPSQE